MKVVLDRHPEIVEHAVEAIRRAGMTPVRGSIRGGTDGSRPAPTGAPRAHIAARGPGPARRGTRGGPDGSRLSFMGLPCANIFAGGHAFHSPLEFVSSQDMDRAVRTIVELARLWEERA